MRADSIVDVMVWITIVALATTIVAHPNSAKIIEAAGKAFASSLKAAQGN